MTNWEKLSKNLFGFFTPSLVFRGKDGAGNDGTDRTCVTGRFYDLFQERRLGGRVEWLSRLCRFLAFLQLKIVRVPRCHILGECVLNPILIPPLSSDNYARNFTLTFPSKGHPIYNPAYTKFLRCLFFFLFNWKYNSCCCCFCQYLALFFLQDNLHVNTFST